MAHLVKMTEWQGGSGNWYCNDCVEISKSLAGYWATPARALGITPAEFVKKLVKEYKPDDVYFDIETDTLVYSWIKQSDMRKFKNWINKVYREKNYII